jgi:hypothetical protein
MYCFGDNEDGNGIRFDFPVFSNIFSRIVSVEFGEKNKDKKVLN